MVNDDLIVGCVIRNDTCLICLLLLLKFSLRLVLINQRGEAHEVTGLELDRRSRAEERPVSLDLCHCVLDRVLVTEAIIDHALHDLLEIVGQTSCDCHIDADLFLNKLGELKVTELCVVQE